MVAVALVWLLDAYSDQSTAAFALLLAADVMAFAIVAHVYRVAGTDDSHSGPPAAPLTGAAIAEPTPASSREVPPPGALPPAVHYAVPVLSILILLAFASMAFFPSNTAALPVQSTVLFIPIYLAIVIFLVLASIYVFKAFVEKDGFRD
ncbi:MAG: hypothetical protein ABSF83_02500 [Nitrososphaerales archaeon]